MNLHESHSEEVKQITISYEASDQVSMTTKLLQVLVILTGITYADVFPRNCVLVAYWSRLLCYMNMVVGLPLGASY